MKGVFFALTISKSAQKRDHNGNVAHRAVRVFQFSLSDSKGKNVLFGGSRAMNEVAVNLEQRRITSYLANQGFL